MKKIIVGITGASGSILGERLVRQLLASGHEAHVILSSSGVGVFKEELGVSLGTAFMDVKKNFSQHYQNNKRLFLSPADDFSARLVFRLHAQNPFILNDGRRQHILTPWAGNDGIRRPRGLGW